MKSCNGCNPQSIKNHNKLNLAKWHLIEQAGSGRILGIKCFFIDIIYSRLLRPSTARGSSTGLVPVDPTKVRARKSILFTECTPEVEITFLFVLLFPE